MNNFNIYSCITNFEKFVECAKDIENIEFSSPPVHFHHWCLQDDIDNLLGHCLDCAYIRKYKIRNYYILIYDDKIGLYECNYSDCSFPSICLSFHFRLTDGKKCLYVEPIENNNPLDEEKVRYILEELVTVECQS
jgi:hypothetical protein